MSIDAAVNADATHLPTALNAPRRWGRVLT